MKVKATKKGFIFGMLMKEGDEFALDHDKQFSKNWMVKLGMEFDANEDEQHVA